MERLRLTNSEKEAILKAFSETVEKANKVTDITFSAKGLINTLNETEIIKPTIVMHTDLMYKMQSLVNESPVEISWHGFVKRNIEKQIYYIYDIALFPQINTATTTTTDQDKYAEWIGEYIKDPESNFEDMRMHGHSHVNMSVFSSGVDDAYQKELLANCQDGDYYIFLIMNKKNEICVLIYDFEQQVLFKNADITLELLTEDRKIIKNWAKEQIKEYCSEPKPTYNRYWDRNKTSGVINTANRKGVIKR